MNRLKLGGQTRRPPEWTSMVKPYTSKDCGKVVMTAASLLFEVLCPGRFASVRGKLGGPMQRLRLNDPAIRLKAIEAIQSLIDHIKVTPTNTGFDVELHGELGAIMEVVDQNDRRPAVDAAGRSLSVVAGVGFEPTTFRL